MPFPISSSGSISVPADSPDSLRAVTLAVEGTFRESNIDFYRKKEDTIEIIGGSFRCIFGRNQRVTIDSGEIRITQQDALIQIHYRISFVRGLLLSSIIIGILFGYLARVSVGVLIMLWLIVIGGNHLVTIYGFPRFLRAAAEKAVLPPPPPS